MKTSIHAASQDRQQRSKLSAFPNDRRFVKLAKPSKRRDLVDVVRTVFWYSGLLLHTGAQNSDQLANFLRTECFSKDESGRGKINNKFQKLARGAHNPSNELVQKIASLYPGTFEDYNHVLWETLRNDSPQLPVYVWLRRLSPEIQRCVFMRVVSENIHTTYIRKDQNPFEPTLWRVHQYPGLDAVACFTILYLEAKQNGARGSPFSLLVHVYRALLTIGSQLQAMGILDAVLELFETRIFARSIDSRASYLIERDLFRELASALRQLVRNSENWETKKHCPHSYSHETVADIFNPRSAPKFSTAFTPDLAMSRPLENADTEYDKSYRQAVNEGRAELARVLITLYPFESKEWKENLSKYKLLFANQGSLLPRWPVKIPHFWPPQNPPPEVRVTAP